MINAVVMFNDADFRAMANKMAKEESEIIKKDVSTTIRDTIRKNANKIIPEKVAQYSPDNFSEKLALVTSSIGKVGDMANPATFMKQPDFMYVNDALRTISKFSVLSGDYGDKFNIEVSLTLNLIKK